MPRPSLPEELGQDRKATVGHGAQCPGKAGNERRCVFLVKAAAK